MQKNIDVNSIKRGKKSGSTWLFNILKAITNASAVSSRFQHPERNHSSILYETLPNLLRSEEYHERNVILKNHFGYIEQRDMLLENPDVVVFNIKRNLPDTVVSAYYYLRKISSKHESWKFRNFYWTRGRLLANEVRNFHALWDSADSDRYYCSSYAHLKSDFKAEVYRITAALGYELDASDIERIFRETSFDRLQKKHGETGLAEEDRFFRKGSTGDWRNHFNKKEARDIARIEEDGLGYANTYLSKLGIYAQKVTDRVNQFFHRAM